MNAYKEIEKITDFQLQQLKMILDNLSLFEIVDRTANKLVVRQEAKNCISMKELIKDWEMVSEDDAGLGGTPWEISRAMPVMIPPNWKPFVSKILAEDHHIKGRFLEEKYSMALSISSSVGIRSPFFSITPLPQT